MKIGRWEKGAFAVIGKEGSTSDGSGFVQRLWDDANSNFGQVQHLAKRDENGNVAGIWGAMTDFSRSFLPWEDNFSRGLYLAGVECVDGAEPPEGWTKWEIPGFTYISVECGEGDAFRAGLDYLAQKGMTLAGAVQDFTCPAEGKSYMLFPVEKK